MKTIPKTILTILICCSFITSKNIEPSTSLISVKIIEEPAQYLGNLNLNNFGNTGYHGQNHQQTTLEKDKLKLRYKPSNFSGPIQFEELNGKCFNYLHNNYKWVVCPFQNVTQYEQSIYKPYKGVLGIWYEWEIKHNMFMTSKMLNGDECGSHGHRKTDINFICNKSSNSVIKNITEPETCSYEVNLETPLACEDLSLGYTMHVYPVLSTDLKSEWNSIYSDFKNGIITEKMYDLSLRNIFEQAKLLQVKPPIIKETVPESSQNDLLDKLTREELIEKIKSCEIEKERMKEQRKKIKHSTKRN